MFKGIEQEFIELLSSLSEEEQQTVINEIEKLLRDSK